VLDALPELGGWEVRLSHTSLLAATLASLALPKQAAASVMPLLATAAGASPAAPDGRQKAWPGIRAGERSLPLHAAVGGWGCGCFGLARDAGGSG
jgi:hypothetical protein